MILPSSLLHCPSLSEVLPQGCAASDGGKASGKGSHGRLNVKNEEIDEMIKEAPGPINFTVFLTMFGEKLKGADPEETILNAFKVFDPEGKGLKSAYIKEMLMTQGERFSQEEIEQMFAAFPPDMSGNLDYKNLVHVITHGEEKD
ncbi:myosin regulatory light chain 2A, cardiac muscle isoform-like [Amazona ochrocephala]